MFQEEKFWYKKCFANNRKIQEQNIVQCKIRSVEAINDKEEFKILHFLLSKTLAKF